jgi:EAL domain-containing protein (putative c-di-GMP-specific phosphodiesterase class I)
METTVTQAPAEQPPVQLRPLTRIAQAVALLLAGWLILRRRGPFELGGRLDLGAGRSADAATPLLRAEVTLYRSAPGTPVAPPRRVASSQDAQARALNVIGDLPRALESEEIVLHYQPIVALGDGTIRGAEGLVRWEHPEHGLLAPAAFIQVVEQTELIGPLTRHVLDRAIAQCSRWRDDGSELSVAVNLSVRNLLDQDIPRDVEQLLSQHSLPPQALQLEITESMIMSDPASALDTVTRLSQLGVHLSVDDFGTGYSSLANLRRLPIDQLKIDRSFVTPMLRDESDLIIVRSTINLGHDLGLQIIAEGVEDRPTLMQLAELGADLAQGYHLSRPLPAPAFDDWRGRAAAAA